MAGEATNIRAMAKFLGPAGWAWRRARRGAWETRSRLARLRRRIGRRKTRAVRRLLRLGLWLSRCYTAGRGLVERALRRGEIRIALAIALIASVFVVLWKVPERQVGDTPSLSVRERLEREDSARRTLVAVIAGGLVFSVGIAGAYFAWRRIMVEQQGQITDRFIRAMEQLGAEDGEGKPRIEIRLGAIRTLERIAQESDEDYRPVMDILAAYLRLHSPRVREKRERETDPEQEEGEEDRVTSEEEAAEP